MIFLMLLGLLQSTYTDLPPECNSLHSSSSPLSSWFVRFWSAGALFGRSANGCRAPTDWVDFFPLPPLPSSPRSAFVSLVGLLFSLQYFGAFWFPCGCDSARVLALFFFSERGREREDGRQVGSLSLHECRGERLGYPRMGAHTHPHTHTYNKDKNSTFFGPPVWPPCLPLPSPLPPHAPVAMPIFSLYHSLVSFSVLFILSVSIELRWHC